MTGYKLTNTEDYPWSEYEDYLVNNTENNKTYKNGLEAKPRSELIDILLGEEPELYTIYSGSLNLLETKHLINLIKYGEPTPIGKEFVSTPQQYEIRSDYTTREYIDHDHHYNSHTSEKKALHDDQSMYEPDKQSGNWHEMNKIYSYDRLYFKSENGIAATQTEVLDKKRWNRLRLNVEDFILINQIRPGKNRSKYYNPYIIRGYSLNSREMRESRHFQLIWGIIYDINCQNECLSAHIDDIVNNYFDTLFDVILDERIKYKSFRFKQYLILNFIQRYIELNTIVQISLEELISYVDLEILKMKIDTELIDQLLKDHKLEWIHNNNSLKIKKLLINKQKYLINEYLNLNNTDLRLIFPGDLELFEQYLATHLNPNFPNQLSKLVFRMGRMKSKYVESVVDIILIGFLQYYMDISLRLYLELKYRNENSKEIRSRHKHLVEIIERSKKYESISELIPNLTTTFNIHVRKQYIRKEYIRELIPLLRSMQSVFNRITRQDKYHIDKYFIITDIISSIAKISTLREKLGSRVFSVFLFRYCQRYLSIEDYQILETELGITEKSSIDLLKSTTEEIF